ncbi:Phage tail tape measure protein [Microbacterium sp. 8M]|uniref:phage tail tape measure protein n=1 Tax=Microbacterium sp. 8M TaxID=2653153 RepID=UPI0012F00274|nr:phage tail tape measure protein [Microbacterium sp. 8M]VXC30548.1 Phage tail tape measure protein [Microbacterium sp. 8M]
MADGVELATAWIRLVPTVEGIQDTLASELGGAESAAAESGKRSGAGFTAGLKGALGVAAIGTAVVGAFKGLYEVGSIFDDVTDTIRVGTGAQGAELEGLVQVAKNVGQNVPVEFDKIGPAVADLNTRLGLTGETLTTVASQYLEAGHILGQDVDINATSAAFNAFKIEGDAVSGAMDNLFQVSQATGVGMNELASGVQAAAPALQNLGFSFQDSVALLGSLDKAGLNSQQVMASLSKGLVTLAKDGEEPQAAFQRVTGEMQAFVDQGNTTAALDLASQIFGTRGAAQFVGALQSGVVNLQDMQAAVGATGDTILGTAAETADFAEQWQVFKNRALTAIEPIGSAIFNLLGQGMEWINSLTADMDFSQFGELLGYLSPLGLIFKAIQPLLPDIMAALGPALQTVISALLPVLQTLVGVFSEFLATVLPPLLPLITMLAGLIGQILTAVTPLLDPLMQLISAIFPILAAVIQAVIPIIEGVVNAISSLLLPIVNMLVDVLGGVITFLTGVFTGNWEQAWNGIVQIFSGLWNGILDIGKGVINSMIDLINGFLGSLNEVGNFVSDVTGGAIDFNVGKIPHLAQGATVLPKPGGTLAVLAEAGRPESVVDTGLLNRALEEGIGGSGQGGVQLIVQPSEGMSEETIGQVAANKLNALLRS